MPVRNGSSNLRDTIKSIISNRITDCSIEIVVVDDASVDGCCDNLYFVGDNINVKIVKCNERIGVPLARNLGVKNSSGEILFITDSHVSFCQYWDKYVFRNINQNRILTATIADATSSFKGYGCSLLIPFMGTKWNKATEGESLFYIHIASSAGTVLHRELFDNIEGYDSDMILYRWS